VFRKTTSAHALPWPGIVESGTATAFELPCYNERGLICLVLDRGCSCVLIRLFFLFIVVPLVELALLMQLAKWTSVGFTLILVLITGAVGIALARAQGFRTYWQIQRELAEGRMPTESLLDAAMILVAGAVLLTPGILTDVFGLSLLLPFMRKLYRAWLVRWFKRRFTVHFQGPAPDASQPGSSRIIDSYVVKRHPDPGASERDAAGDRPE
jgi:UPF0716 protein FxsA